jgi:apolipoprotein N-acyltransferase
VKSRNWWQLPLTAVLCGGVLAFALPTVFPIIGTQEMLPRGELTVLAYIALVPLLVRARSASPKLAFGVGVLCALGYYSVAIWWVYVAMNTFGGISPSISIAILYLLIGYLALFWGGAFALTAAICGDGATRPGRGGHPYRPPPRWLVLPLAFTALEILRNYLFSGFPWANLGYTLARDRWALQLASLCGVYGLAFVAMGCNAALAEWWVLRRPAPAWALLVVVGVPHLYGAVRLPLLERELAKDPTLSIALLQGNIDQKIKNAAKGGTMGFPEYRNFILDRYVPLTREADRAGVDLIIWPEASLPGALPLRPQQLPPWLGDEEFRAQLLLGGVTAGIVDDRRLLTNSAFALDRQRNVLFQYDKHHLVPFGEYVPLEKTLHLPIHKVVPDIGFFDPGADMTVFSVTPLDGGKPATYGPLICFDAIFPEISVELARKNPDFLVNMTNDAWYGFSSAAYQFLSIVAVRAVETGKSVARAANTGITAFIDPTGRVLSRTKIGLVHDDSPALDARAAVPPEMLISTIPLHPRPTPYVVIGDAFAYLCGAATLLLWLRARRANAPRRSA